MKKNISELCRVWMWMYCGVIESLLSFEALAGYHKRFRFSTVLWIFMYSRCILSAAPISWNVLFSFPHIRCNRLHRVCCHRNKNLHTSDDQPCMRCTHVMFVQRFHSRTCKNCTNIDECMWTKSEVWKASIIFQKNQSSYQQHILRCF